MAKRLFVAMKMPGSGGALVNFKDMSDKTLRRNLRWVESRVGYPEQALYIESIVHEMSERQETANRRPVQRPGWKERRLK